MLGNFMNSATLILDNGSHFNAVAHNLAHELISGEVVFNTGMTGYEETLTDPSYAGQILVFTYPLLGNYGVSSAQNWESMQIQVKAVICANLIHETAHHDCEHSLLDCLHKQGIPILSGIDTRELTKILRDNGTMNGQIKLTSNNIATQAQPTQAENFVAQVSTKEISYHGTGKYQILLVDFGVKQNIIRSLLNFDVTIKQVPFDYDYSHEQCDGILLSNGPGDPKACNQSIAILKAALRSNIPIFGICLGSQLLGLAAGADTYKLKFGHRGQNQPVQDTQSLRCYLSSQNHGYALCHNSLPEDWQITFTHLHDNSIAGIKHKSKPFSAVQFHPEAAAGPHDTAFLFNDFIQQIMMGAQQK